MLKQHTPFYIPLPLQAFEKNPKDADTLANLVAVSLHLGKPAGRYMSQVGGGPGMAAGSVGAHVGWASCG